ncbi:MAG: hypothetical protein K2O88_06730 [Paramuribaculum sp.]|nr:hypothetical protein [Paramuribaculum sp.]
MKYKGIDYDFIFRFADIDDCRVFIEMLKSKGFKYHDMAKDGGVIYIDSLKRLAFISVG